LATDMLGSQSRALYRRGFSLSFLSQKNGAMDWGPGPAKSAPNFQNMPSLWRHLQKSSH